MRLKVLSLFVIGVSFIALGLLRHIREEHLNANPLPVIGTIPDIELIDSSGAAFPLGQLKNKAWILNLFYTTCDGPCPQTSARLSSLQNALPQAHFVSLSIDPKHDTPELLQQYAKKLSAKAGHWTFLTGDEEQVRNLVVDDLRMATRDNLEVHGTKLMLVDAELRIRGLYDVQDPDSLNRLAQDLERIS